MTKTQKIFVWGVLVLVAAFMVQWVWWYTNVRSQESAEKSNPDGQVCIQVITPARNPETGETRDFPTPCDVPSGWTVVQPTPVE